MKKKLKFKVVKVIGISLVLLGYLPCVLAEDAHKLSVSGNATVYKPADKVNFTLGVMTFEKEAQDAIEANTEKMDAVLDALTKAGLDEKEFHTGNFTINPRYAPPPAHPSKEWQPSIVGYEVLNVVDIRTTKLDSIEAVIGAAGKSGANLVHNLVFALQDEKPAKSEAIALAVQQARWYASVAAAEAGVKLGDIVDLAINAPYINVASLKAERFAYASQNSAAGLTPPIISGDVEVSASVSLIYRIQ